MVKYNALFICMIKDFKTQYQNLPPAAAKIIQNNYFNAGEKSFQK